MILHNYIANSQGKQFELHFCTKYNIYQSIIYITYVSGLCRAGGSPS